MATIYDQNRVEVSLSQISRTMVKAIVAIEDYRFYEHGALDLGHLRLPLLLCDGATVQGGSSITQQLVKQTLVTQASTDEERREATATDYARKLHASCATPSRWRRSTARTGSWSATSTSPTSATAPTASRRRPSTTSTSTRARLDLRQSAMLAGLVQSPDASTPPTTPTGPWPGATSSWTGWPKLNVIPAGAGRPESSSARSG